MDKPDFADYDYFHRRGVFHKCNGITPEFQRDESDVAVSAYFDGYDANETIIDSGGEAEELEIEFTPETKIFAYYTGDDLAEGIFDEGGQLLGAWSPNDANWRTEYFSPFMEKLGIIVCEGNAEIHDKPLREWAMNEWGLTAEEVDLDGEE